MNRRAPAAAGFLLVAASCGLAPSGPGPSPAPARGGLLRVGTTEIGPLDPARVQTAASQAILRTACDGLIALDPETGEPRPALASGWKVESGARRMTLRLRPKVRFHDGGPVDAASVAESLARVARPETASPWASLLAQVEGYEEVRAGASSGLSGLRATDRGTLEIALAEPFAEFPTVLAHPALIPVSPASEPEEPPACSGPYRIEAAAEGEVRLKRFPASRSRNEAYAGDGKGFAETIVVKAFETTEDAYQGRKRGDVDIAPVPEGSLAEAAAGRGYARRQTLEVTYLAFDTSRPPTDNAGLRRALSLAIDRLVIIDAAFGDERQPALRWLEEAKPTPSECATWVRRIADPERARAALEGVAGSLSMPLAFDTARVGRLVAQALGVQVQDVLAVALQLQPLEAPAFEASIRDRTAGGAWLLTAAPDLPIADRVLGSLFRTGSPDNRLGFSSPKLDGLLEAARGATDGLDRGRLYAQAEDLVCEAMPAAPLWTGVRHWTFAPDRVRFEDEPKIDLFGEPVLRHARGIAGGG